MNKLANKPSLLLIFSAIAIALCSLARWYLTGSIQVDNNEVHSWHMYPIVLTFIISILVTLWTLLKIVLRKPGYNLTLDQTFYTALTLVGIMFFMMPMLSSDTATYLVIGDLGIVGKSVYVNASYNMESNFTEYLSPYWIDCPNHYGPPMTFIFMLSVWLGKSYIGSHIVMKLIFILFGILYLHQVKIFFKKRAETKWNVAALLLLSPAFWMQGIGHFHVDAIITLFIFLMLLYLLNNKWLLASIFLGLIVSSKTMYAAVFIPFFLVYLFMTNKPNFGKLLMKYATSLVMGGIVFVLFYWYWWEGTATLTTALNYHEFKSPSRSFVEMISDIIYYIKIFIDPAVAELDRTEVLLPIWDVMKSIFKYLGLTMAAWVGLQIFYVKKKEEVITIFGKLLVVAILFFSANFHPWYCMIFLPFFMFEKEKSWFVFLVIISTISNLHEITYTVPGDSAIFWLVAPLVFIMLCTFLLYYRKHFILETWNRINSYKFFLKDFFLGKLT